MFSRIFTLFLALWLSLPANANLFGKAKFLPAEQAFILSSTIDSQGAELHWQIAEGYYLYKKELSLSLENGELEKVETPPGEWYHDEFFGDVEIFRRELTVRAPFAQHSPQSKLIVQYQGCTKGFCYPPTRVELALNEAANTANAQAYQETETNHTAGLSEQQRLAEDLTQSRANVFWFFVLGLALAFTPCVLPMLPLLSAIVIGANQRPNSKRALLLSVSYVQGMALTYTLLGLVVAAIGMPFQVALQSPPVLITLSLLFTLLALSMFGLFELKLPNSWQQKLTKLSQEQRGGSISGVFVMGMIAGLIASPCTSAPLSGALLYVAQSGDLLLGGAALYLLALGMGLPLVLVTLFGNRILPKSGEWLLKVKTMFGFVMLALPVFLLSRVFVEWENYLWSALALSFLLWSLEQAVGKGWKNTTLRLLIALLLIIAAKPWHNLLWGEPNPSQNTHLTLTRVQSLSELNSHLQAAQGKKVMLDLYADWCVACKEFEKYTFSDPAVQQQLEQMVVLQVDMTKNSTANDELMKHFEILGLPTILFFDETGKEQNASRLTGFLNAPAFLEWLKQL